jgi:hypothetical protein
VGKRRRIWWWIAGGVLLAVLAFVAVLAVPMLTHEDQGQSQLVESEEEWPLTATAIGDDGRTRALDLHPVEPGGSIDPSALEVGERIVVSGTGFDADRGIYVAICKVPEDPGVKPGPCLGGVPSTDGEAQEQGAVQFAPSNWINDDWAWKLFGARGYDDAETGTFTAYLEVPSTTGDGVDCRVDACAITTRNDHTALNDRVQDVSIPVGFD